MSITVEVDEAIFRAAEAATDIHDPRALVLAGLAKLAGRAAVSSDEEIYTEDRLREFAEGEAELGEWFQRHDAR